MSLSQMLFSFRGRIARLPFFGYFLLGMVFVGVLFFSSFFVLASGDHRNSGLTQLLGFGMLFASFIGYVWVSAALNVKRLHDLGLSGIHLIWLIGIGAVAGGTMHTNQTISVICFVMQFCAALWLMFAPGQPQANQFGPPPGVTFVPQGYAPAPGPMPAPVPGPQPTI